MCWQHKFSNKALKVLHLWICLCDESRAMLSRMVLSDSWNWFFKGYVVKLSQFLGNILPNSCIYTTLWSVTHMVINLDWHFCHPSFKPVRHQQIQAGERITGQRDVWTFVTKFKQVIHHQHFYLVKWFVHFLSHFKCTNKKKAQEIISVLFASMCSSCCYAITGIILTISLQLDHCNWTS